MSSGAWHYREAERLAAASEDRTLSEWTRDHKTDLAKLHATLALAGLSAERLLDESRVARGWDDVLKDD